MPIGGLCLRQQLTQGCAAALVAEQRQIVLVKAAAHRPKVRQRQGYVRQNAPAALLGGFQRNAVVALILLLLFFGGGDAVAAEEGYDVGSAQLHPVLDDLFQLVLLGVARQQRHLHGGLGGAGVARLYGKIHPVLPKAGDGGGVLYGVAVAEDDGIPRLCPHHPGKVMGVRTPQGGGAVRDLGGKVAVRHTVRSFLQYLNLRPFCRRCTPSRAFP